MRIATQLNTVGCTQVRLLHSSDYKHRKTLDVSDINISYITLPSKGELKFTFKTA